MDNEGDKSINNKYRGIDKSTDVFHFLLTNLVLQGTLMILKRIQIHSIRKPENYFLRSILSTRAYTGAGKEYGHSKTRVGFWWYILCFIWWDMTI